MAWDTRVENAITGAAQRHGVDPNLLRTFARIESGGRPTARTGSYRGLFQLSQPEFSKWGGTGNIYDPDANANAAAQKLANESQAFKMKFGRDPQPNDLYMIHQQGQGGYAAHTANPNAPAWQNMASTAEGRAKGPGWAKQAIWGNVPSDVRGRYPGGVDSLTSQQFLDLWAEKVARMGGNAQPSAYMAANAANEVSKGGPMAAPIGGAPIAGGPVPLTPPSQRYSKLADALMAQAAGAQVNGWGDALRAFGGAALGYSLGNKADKQQQEYQGSLAKALMGASGNNDQLASTLIGSGDPQLVQQGVALKVAQAKPQALSSDIQEYQFAMNQRKQAGQPEIPYDAWIKEVKAKQADSGYGTNLYQYKTQDGKTVAFQTSKAGGRKDLELPEGAEYLPGIDYKDTGTEFVPVQKKTGQVAGPAIAKDVAGKERLEETGKAQGQAIADLPRVESNSDAILSMIDSVAGDPYLPSMTGAVQGRLPNLSGDAQRVQAKVDQLNGQAFLQAFSALKGGGAITEAEGAKATASLSRLQNMKVNDPDYGNAIKDFRNEVTRLRDLARRKAGVVSQQGLQQRIAQPAAAPAQAAAPSAPPMEGAKQAPDGHWYVEQNGQFFRVDN